MKKWTIEFIRKLQQVPAFAGPDKSGSTLRYEMTSSVIIVLFLVFFGCKPATVKEVATEKAIPVKVAEVEFGEVNMAVKSTGFIATREEVKLSFKTGGIVARTLVKEGDSVKKGQLLAELNLAEINAQVNQAKNIFEKAERDYSRAENLYTDSVATLEQVQNAETALNVAKSVMDMAQFNLKHSKIVAPENGVILKQLIRQNELVGPGYPVYLLGVSGKQWIIKTGLADREVVKIHAGDSASVTIDAWPEEKFSARVDQIGEVANAQTGTYEVELLLNPTERRLATGFMAKVTLYPSQKDSFYLIPIESIVEANHHTGYVFIPSAGFRAKKIAVTIGNLTDTKAAISSGLEHVPHVISTGAAFLKEGDLIIINQ